MKSSLRKRFLWLFLIGSGAVLACYEAKKQGRNCAIIHRNPTEF